MPQMPDPISRCPIFNRLEEKSADPDAVEEMIYWMDTYNNDIIQAGPKMGIISDVKCWHPEGAPTPLISEVDYLRDLFFPPTPWWIQEKIDYEQKHGMGFFEGFNQALRQALDASMGMSGNPKHSVPIKGYWECVGSDISIVTKRFRRRRVVWFRVQTPPPPEDWVCP